MNDFAMRTNDSFLYLELHPLNSELINKGGTMARLCLLILSLLIIPAIANAEETKVLYYQHKIPGPQVTKEYYIKESLKKENPKNPNLLQVKNISIVKSPEGTTTYRLTSRINCETRQIAIIDYWSTGTNAEQQRAMANGKWKPIDDFDDALHLFKKICLKK